MEIFLKYQYNGVFEDKKRKIKAIDALLAIMGKDESG
jgi:hypothetical protein